MQDKIEELLRAAMKVDKIEVTGGSGGHYSIKVVSKDFAGKNLLQKQRLIMSPLKDLMSGDMAPVHAIDQIVALESE